MTRRAAAVPGSGRIVARGTVLVDPRAAIAKLREYLLPEPVLYVIEIVRVAVAGGASVLAMDNDTEDLVLTFDGQPLDARDLTHLLDHLFSPADRRLRLMALAVNTALGLRPRFVDLYTTRHDHAADTIARVRWLPEHALPDESGTNPGREPTSEPVPRPDGFPKQGMRVHVRERFGAAVMREWLSSEPAETRVLRARTGALRIPIMVRGRPLEPLPSPRLLLSENVEARDGVRVCVGLVADRDDANTLELCELGVLLERRTLIAQAGAVAARWPLWMRVDARELPTNASRSRVDLDGAFGRTVSQSLSSALEKLLPRAVAIAASSEGHAVRETLIMLIIAARGASWAASVSPDSTLPIIDSLLDAPLVPLATGGSTSPRSFAVRHWSQPRCVWRGREPIANDLAPWIAEMAWLPSPDSALATLLAPLQLQDAGPALAQAREARSRYERFLAHPPRLPRVADHGSTEVLRVGFGTIPGEALDALEYAAPRVEAPDGIFGEIVVRGPFMTQGYETVLTPHLGGRPLATERFQPSPLPLEIALQAPDIRARPAFDGVERNQALQTALWAAENALATAIEFVAAAWVPGARLAHDDLRCAWIRPGSGAMRAVDRAALVRTGLLLRIGTANDVDARRAIASELLSRHSLTAAAAWVTTDPAHVVSTQELVALAAKPPHAVRVAPPGTTGSPPDANPVIVLAPSEHELLEAFLPADTRLIPYAKFIPARPGRFLRDLLKFEDAAAHVVTSLEFESDGVRGAIAPTELDGSTVLAHGGHLVEVRPPPCVLGSASLVVDADAFMPDESGTIVLPDSISGPAHGYLEGIEFDLATALVRVIAGDSALAIELGRVDANDPAPAAIRFLLQALVSLRKLQPACVVGLRWQTTPARLTEQIETLPLFRIARSSAQTGRVTVRDLVARAASQPVPVLRVAHDDIDYDSFEPLILGSTLVEQALNAAGVVTIDGDIDLEARRKARVRRMAREALAARGEIATLDDLRPLSDRAPVRASITGLGTVSIALPRDGASSTQIQVLVGGRVAIGNWVIADPYPVVARVEFSNEESLTPSLDALTRAGIATLEALLRNAVMNHLRAIARAARDAEADVGPAARALVVHWVAVRGRRRNAADTRLDKVLADAPLWNAPDRRRVSASECVYRNRALYTTTEFAQWLPPPKDVHKPDPAVVLVPRDVDRNAWVLCLGTLAGTNTGDATKELERIQRQRRLLERGGEPIALQGPAPEAKLAGRIERLAPRSVGVGEMRLVPPTSAAPSIRLLLFVDGIYLLQREIVSPIALEVALESPLLDPARLEATISKSKLVEKLLRGARKLLNAAISNGVALPPWSASAVRWHLLTSDSLPAGTRKAAAFLDTLGNPMNVADLDSQSEMQASVSYATAMPPEPCDLGNTRSRVVVLAPHEVAWLRSQRIGRDCDALIDAAYRARIRQLIPPVEVVTVPVQLPRDALRYRLDRARDGYEGEIVLLPPGAAAQSTVHWYLDRRPLGEHPLAATWPARVAIEVPQLTVDGVRGQPVEDAVFEAVLGYIPSLVDRAIVARLGPPADALASITASDPRSPGFSLGAPRVVGSLWLAPDPLAAPSFRVTLSDGTPPQNIAPVVSVPGLSRTRVAIHANLWLSTAASADGAPWGVLVEDLVRWAFRALLDGLIAKGPASAQSPAALAHLVAAALDGMLATSEADEWARRNLLPKSKMSFRVLRSRVAAGGTIAVVEPGDPRAQEVGVIPRTEAPWFRVLVARGHATSGPESDTALRPAAAAPVSPALPGASSAVVPIIPVHPVLGRVRELLLRGGLDPVTIRNIESVPGRSRAPITFDPQTRDVRVFEDHPVAAALLHGEPGRGARIVVLAILGEVNRALAGITDADEERMLEVLLEEMV